MIRRAAAAGGALAAGVGAWGLWESQWVRAVTIDLPIAGLPPPLDGLRVGHVSDLHVGAPGLNVRALRAAVDALAAADPDLVCLTGDLRARVAGDHALRSELARLAPPLGAFAVLGNHDHGDGHDPFADGVPLRDLAGTRFRLLADERVRIAAPGGSIGIAGMAPVGFARDPTRAGRELVDPDADLRILLCHYPRVLDRLRPGDYQLVLAGHLHGGQICLPFPGGKLRLSHLSRAYLEGVYGREGTVMHISRGVGTTFVPIRVAARPEVTVLVLRAAEGPLG